ncbi:MAG: protein SCO1/2, partial [Myxococcota bacterium]
MANRILTTIVFLAVAVAGGFLAWNLKGDPPAGPDKAGRPSTKLPVLATVPEFALRSHLDQPFTSKSLDGGLWIANLTWTGCTERCPENTRDIGRMLHRPAAGTVWRGVHFLSISVDPQTDTVEVLRRAAEHAGSTGSRWRFLTGERAEIQRLGEVVFAVAAAGTETGPIFSGSPLALIDGQGRVRGRYPGTDRQTYRALRADVKRLLAEVDQGSPSSEAVETPLTLEALDPGAWLTQRAEAQVAAARDSATFTAFRFVDRV